LGKRSRIEVFACDTGVVSCELPVDAGQASAPRAPAIPPAAAAAPGEEERRLVTILFCGLVGFTALSERLDPEDVREIQTAYFDSVNREIARFGGTVEKYAGDAVLAWFGVPAAHEDDAERAVRCAVAMRSALEALRPGAGMALPPELRLRVGITTGEVVSGTWEAAGRKDLSVSGNAVNTAARLQTAAEPGEILIGEQTWLLAERGILVGALRDLALKGRTELVHAYSVVGLRNRPVERWERQRAPFIGREPELGSWMRPGRRPERKHDARELILSAMRAVRRTVDYGRSAKQVMPAANRAHG
jgi:class 3 adenylate cyclase